MSSRRPPRGAELLLLLGLICLSQAGNLVKLADAPVLAIAFYRLTFGALVLLPFGIRQLVRARGKELGALVIGALFFSAHFLAWFYGVKHTAVANAMALFCANPLFAALGGVLVLREPVGRSRWIALSLGFLGILVTTGGDLVLRPENTLGNLSTILSGALFAGYIVAGRFYRQKLGVWGGFSGTLSIGALLVGGVALGGGTPLHGFDPTTWLALGLLVVFPTLVGHGLFNFSMRYFSPATLSGLTLVEPVLGGLVAWFLFQEAPSPGAWLGYSLIVASAWLLLRGEIRNRADALSNPRQDPL